MAREIVRNGDNMIRFRIRQLLLETTEAKKTGVPPTIKDLAEEVGITRQVLSNMCRPGYSTNSEHIDILLNYFRIEPNELHRLMEFTPDKSAKKMRSR